MRAANASVSSYALIKSSELVAHTNRRRVRGYLVDTRRREQEAVGETVRYLRPHDTGVGIEVPREAPIRDERSRVQLSAAA